MYILGTEYLLSESPFLVDGRSTEEHRRWGRVWFRPAFGTAYRVEAQSHPVQIGGAYGAPAAAIPYIIEPGRTAIVTRWGLGEWDVVVAPPAASHGAGERVTG